MKNNWLPEKYETWKNTSTVLTNMYAEMEPQKTKKDVSQNEQNKMSFDFLPEEHAVTNVKDSHEVMHREVEGPARIVDDLQHAVKVVAAGNVKSSKNIQKNHPGVPLAGSIVKSRDFLGPLPASSSIENKANDDSIDAIPTETEEEKQDVVPTESDIPIVANTFLSPSPEGDESSVVLAESAFITTATVSTETKVFTSDSEDGIIYLDHPGAYLIPEDITSIQSKSKKSYIPLVIDAYKFCYYSEFKNGNYTLAFMKEASSFNKACNSKIGNIDVASLLVEVTNVQQIILRSSEKDFSSWDGTLFEIMIDVRD